jgi:hypothetical protein
MVPKHEVNMKQEKRIHQLLLCPTELYYVLILVHTQHNAILKYIIETVQRSFVNFKRYGSRTARYKDNCKFKITSFIYQTARRHIL